MSTTCRPRPAAVRVTERLTHRPEGEAAGAGRVEMIVLVGSSSISSLTRAETDGGCGLRIRSFDPTPQVINDAR